MEEILNRETTAMMNYVEGQIIAFGLRALYRLGMSLAEEKPEDKKKHLQVMKAHIDFVTDCIEVLPPKTE